MPGSSNGSRARGSQPHHSHVVRTPWHWDFQISDAACFLGTRGESSRVLTRPRCRPALCFTVPSLPWLLPGRLVSVLKLMTNKGVHGHVQRPRAASVQLWATWSIAAQALPVLALLLPRPALPSGGPLMARSSDAIVAKNMTQARENGGRNSAHELFLTPSERSVCRHRDCQGNRFT